MGKNLFTGDQRTQLLLAAAIKIAMRPGGWNRLTSGTVAAKCGCARTLIFAYWPTLADLKRAILEEAVQQGYLPIVAQALADGDKMALRLNPIMKHKAATALTEF